MKSIKGLHHNVMLDLLDLPQGTGLLWGPQIYLFLNLLIQFLGYSYLSASLVARFQECGNLGPDLLCLLVGLFTLATRVIAGVSHIVRLEGINNISFWGLCMFHIGWIHDGPGSGYKTGLTPTYFRLIYDYRRIASHLRINLSVPRISKILIDLRSLIKSRCSIICWRSRHHARQLFKSESRRIQFNSTLILD